MSSARPRPRSSRRTTPCRPTLFQPWLELLEVRVVPSVLTVTSLADSGSGTLRAAIQSAAAGDTVQFAVSGTIALSSELQIVQALTIQGANRITVQGGSNVRAFDVFGGGSVILDGLTLTGGNLGSLQNGGAVLFNGGGTLTVSNSYVAGNSANSAGGLENSGGGTVNLANDTFANNQAGFGGVAGAVWNNGGTLNVTNCTFSGNVSNTNEAGAIWNSGGGTTTLLNDTISGNRSNLAGGGVWNQSGVTNVKNTVIAGNTSATASPDVVGGPFNDQGHNLIGDATGSTGFANGVNGSMVGSAGNPLDPMLDQLANNGGPVPTLAPHSGSPALNDGDPNGAPATDERGAPRSGPTVDIGALQYGHFIVTNTNDSGFGSLRQAIFDADGHPGADLITFAIPGAAGQVIAPPTDLPAITEAVTVDAFTQPGASPNTLAVGENAVYGVLLNGTADSGGGVGLNVRASGVTVRGLEIADFASAGIAVTGNNNLLTGNSVHNSGNVGVLVLDNSTGNVLGGTAPADRNVVYSNANKGVALVGANDSGNVLLNDYIGTPNGTAAPGGQNVGVFLESQAHDNVIGGPAPGAGNVISGNVQVGVVVTMGGGSSASRTTVQGNFIGLTADGSAALANGVGVEADFGSFGNAIGGPSAGDGNVISGNTGDGVLIAGASGTLVQDNLIGTDPTGTVARGNGRGVEVDDRGGEVFRGNVVSGNSGDGMLFTFAQGPVVVGNFIGTDVTGKVGLGNGGNGVTVQSPGVTVGGTTPADHNVISANRGSGVLLGGGGDSVSGNLIGTDLTGTARLGNGGDGVGVFGMGGDTVGGTAVGSGNLISANGGNGVVLDNTGGSVVFGNFIGTDTTGSVALGNAGDGVRVENGSGGSQVGTAGAGNVISGNGGNGVDLTDANTRSSVVAANFIGTNSSGTAAIANARDGVIIANSAFNNTVGPGNLISGNTGSGVTVNGPGTGNVVTGDLIGTDPSGRFALGNRQHGVQVNAPNTTVGGTTPSTRNVISGNGVFGVFLNGTSGSLVVGNYIGTDASGTAALGNALDGVGVGGGASNNAIGGTAAGDGNVISANGQWGVEFSNGSNNTLQGNFIGTDVTGTAPLGNRMDGVVADNGSAGNTIGGTTAAARNVISANGGAGVALGRTGLAAGTGNVVEGNYIGLNAAGAGAAGFGNAFEGVLVNDQSSGEAIGGTAAGAGNFISGNGFAGVGLVNATNVSVLGNVIGLAADGVTPDGNGGDGVSLGSGQFSTSGNTVGAPGAGNVIAANAGNGVHLSGTAVTNTTVAANRIGTNASGAALGNAGDGVRVDGGATGALIGVASGGQGNTIAFNSKGVVVADPGTAGIAILGNSIYANAGIGIDLGDDGPTPNAPGGPHTGPNGLPNFPILTSFSGGVVTGTLNSAPNTTYRIEFFSSPTNGPAGQGKTFLGAATVTTDSAGNAAFGAAISSLPAGEDLTATATDVPAKGTGSTSEFTVEPAATAVATGGKEQTAVVTTTFASPLQVTVLDALGNPLYGVAVTFAAPATRASGLFGGGDGQPGVASVVVFTDQFGVATSPFYTANTVAGPDGVTASVSGAPSLTFHLTNTPDKAFRFDFAGPTSPVAGAAAGFTLTAKDVFGNVATGFAGTVSFASSDGRATLPAAYTFTTADAGAHVFSATFRTAGTVTLTANSPGLAAAATTFVVQPGAAVTLAVDGFPSTTPAGVAGSVNVTALDAFGNVATGFTGLIDFSSDDPTAELPAAGEQLAGGVGTFPVTFLTSGDKTIAATAEGKPALAGTQENILITAVLLPSPVAFIPVELQPFSFVVASFTSNLSLSPADYAALISWGDGTEAAGVVSTQDGRTFFVTGAHTYPSSTNYLVDVAVTYRKTGAFETTAPSVAAVVSAAEGQQLAESSIVRGKPGDKSLSANNGVVDAELTQPNPGSLSATVFVARYRDNPKPAFSLGTNYYDVRVTNAGPDAFLVVTFTFTEATATAASLRFFDPKTGQYLPVQSATRFPVVVDLAAHTITVTFDATSFPLLKELTGTVFSIAVTVPPPAPQTSLSPAASLALAGQSGPAQEVTFQPSSQLSLSLAPSQAASLNAARADLTGAADPTEMTDEDYRFLIDLLNASLNDRVPPPDLRPSAGPLARREAVEPEGQEPPAAPETAPGVPPATVGSLDAFFAEPAWGVGRLALPPENPVRSTSTPNRVSDGAGDHGPALAAAPLAGAMLAGIPGRGRTGRRKVRPRSWGQPDRG